MRRAKPTAKGPACPFRGFLCRSFP